VLVEAVKKQVLAAKRMKIVLVDQENLPENVVIKGNRSFI